MKNNNKSIIDKINKEYSFRYKFLKRKEESIWGAILEIALIAFLGIFFSMFYPGFENFNKLFKNICKLLNVTINENNFSFVADIFSYFILIITLIITSLILKLIYYFLLKITMKQKNIIE